MPDMTTHPYHSLTESTIGPPSTASWRSVREWELWVDAYPAAVRWSVLIDRRTGAVVDDRPVDRDRKGKAS